MLQPQAPDPARASPVAELKTPIHAPEAAEPATTLAQQDARQDAQQDAQQATQLPTAPPTPKTPQLQSPSTPDVGSTPSTRTAPTHLSTPSTQQTPSSHLTPSTQQTHSSRPVLTSPSTLSSQQTPPGQHVPSNLMTRDLPSNLSLQSSEASFYTEPPRPNTSRRAATPIPNLAHASSSLSLTTETASVTSSQIPVTSSPLWYARPIDTDSAFREAIFRPFVREGSVSSLGHRASTLSMADNLSPQSTSAHPPLARQMTATTYSTEDGREVTASSAIRDELSPILKFLTIVPPCLTQRCTCGSDLLVGVFTLSFVVIGLNILEIINFSKSTDVLLPSKPALLVFDSINVFALFIFVSCVSRIELFALIGFQVLWCTIYTAFAIVQIALEIQNGLFAQLFVELGNSNINSFEKLVIFLVKLYFGLFMYSLWFSIVREPEAYYPNDDDVSTVASSIEPLPEYVPPYRRTPSLRASSIRNLALNMDLRSASPPPPYQSDIESQPYPSPRSSVHSLQGHGSHRSLRSLALIPTAQSPNQGTSANMFGQRARRTHSASSLSREAQITMGDIPLSRFASDIHPSIVTSLSSPLSSQASAGNLPRADPRAAAAISPGTPVTPELRATSALPTPTINTPRIPSPSHSADLGEPDHGAAS
ncbi:uncharacterized protein BJ171DRAFT_502817 [Polychytrium aggregatum]|uniref:uncharacterized protein n=1 Tax=Polychytrium aggregatum TaxID=110093 RepID=UPI0022FDE49B|nr:uncharacterized protein BJ171DRAFT_502817 [Polychytrium aggregatum]KAI9205049.1 hypothetical protein BJ171DRAFT_502817 [Polychytrium aggregatum]